MKWPSPLRRHRRRARRGSAALAGAAFASIAQRLPERAALRLGTAVGRAAWYFLPRRRRQARANLQIAFPDWDDPRRDEIARASFGELGRSLAEWGRLVTLDPDELRERVSIEGLEHARKALAAGRGLLFATAHYGNWEILPAAWRAAVPDVELVVVGRRFDDAALQRRIEKRRVLLGGELLEPDARAILRALRRGVAVGVLVDLYTPERRSGILVEFFGRRCWTTAGPATLALRTGAPLVPVFVRRVGGIHHQVVISPPLEITPTGDRGRDIRDLTERLAAVVEARVREQPEAWLWLHRRWKRSPDLD